MECLMNRGYPIVHTKNKYIFQFIMVNNLHIIDQNHNFPCRKSGEKIVFRKSLSKTPNVLWISL